MSETNDTPARPEGEMCPACHRGNLVPWRNGVECPECRYTCTPLTPTPPARERGEATPAPASGEEAKVCDLCDTPLTPKDWPNGYRTWYCATCSIPGELRPRLRAAKAEVARLTRELAEARAELVKTQELLGISVSRTTAARAEAARLREALAQNAELLDGVMAAGAFNRGRLWEHIREVAMQMRRALGQEGA